MQRDKEFSGIYKRGLETAENVDRKDFTPSEAVKAWQEIEAKKANQYTKLPPSESDGSEPREQATKLTGYGHDTLSKAKQVVEIEPLLAIETKQGESQRAVIASRLANMQLGDNQYKSGSANLPTLSQPEAAGTLNIMPVKQTDNRLINQITLGNNVDILPDIESNSVDLILTDPPYIMALADLYKSWNFRNHDFEFYAEQFNRILNPNGSLAMFCDYLTSLAIGNAFVKHFRFRFYWIWIKSNGQPVNKKQPRSNVELITVWAKKKAKTKDLVFNPIFEKGLPYTKKHKAGNKTRKQEKDYTTVNTTGDRYPSQTLYYPSKDNLPQAERTDHPTQKAVGLCSYLIRTLSNEGDLIFDPFSGSGSTAIACHRLKRNFIAIEKDPEYYIESLGRLERERCQITLPF